MHTQVKTEMSEEPFGPAPGVWERKYYFISF
jgi:hypothetical protein